MGWAYWLITNFLYQLNHNNFNLTFTMTWDCCSITCLDVTIHKDENGLLTSSLYRKPTAGNSIPHTSSFHPQALISSIPYSQCLRIRRGTLRPKHFAKRLVWFISSSDCACFYVGKTIQGFLGKSLSPHHFNEDLQSRYSTWKTCNWYTRRGFS